MIKQFDYYYGMFLIRILMGNKKLIKFGSLKSYVALENYNNEPIDKDFKEVNKIILISSVAENYAVFFKKFLLDKISVEKN